MRKVYSVLSVLFLSCFAALAQMNDDAMREYIAEGLAMGKSQTQIGNELLAKGVSVSQAKRAMLQYSKSLDAGIAPTIKHIDVSRPPARSSSFVQAEIVSKDKEDIENEKNKKTAVLKQDGKEVVIYGHDLFNAENLSFEPNQNSATPFDYILGPGDKIIVDVWGTNEATLRQEITPEGKIFVDQIGPISLAGLTIEQATAKLRHVLSRKYSSLAGQNPTSELCVTLGGLRTIQVHVLGEVKLPGTYRLSSMSNVFNAIYSAKGVSSIGSVRNIQISRGGKIVAVADLYKFLFEGKNACNISLRDGDAIIVPPYTGLVEMTGGIKRAMYYETVVSDRLSDIINYAGGFISNAFLDEITVQRVNGDGGDVFTVKKSDYPSFKLQDGDLIYVYQNTQTDYYANRLSIKGAVLRPGVYELGNDIATVRQLVNHSGGLLDEAYKNRAQIIRERPDRSLEIKAIAIGAILDGTCDDIMLRKNDIIVVPFREDVEIKGALTINGFVTNPGDYEFAEGMTVEDLILLAGGLEEGASSLKVEVSRRIVDTYSLSAKDTLAEIFSINISDSLKLSDASDFILRPYDIVSVRKSPSYVIQKKVRITGEATFPGEYTMLSNNERISDLFKRAGGATANAYIGGAVLKRKVTEDERNVRRNLVTMMKKGGNRRDSTMVDKLKINETYSVGISLDDALASPGSVCDLILQDGDELVIPSMTNTVRIQGEVMYPNAVNYMKGQNVRYYIDQSGGFSNEAKRSKVYVIYMNGKVSVGRGSKIVPGCEVVVPSRPERRKMTVGEWLGMGTTAASITTMAVTIGNIIINTQKKN